jgi:hypothetical protein
MRAMFYRTSRLLDATLDIGPRLMMLVAALLLIAIYIFPLWRLTMFAPQYHEGLRMDIFSYKLEGGNDNQDIREINVLNHYIGMKDLVADDFTEFKWMPFVVGAIGLLTLRAVVHGKLAHLIDVVVLFFYFSAFSLWSFAYKLWWYGHNLEPTAPVKVDPFMPPLFGYKQLANFEVYSYPGAASYALGISMVLLLVAIVAAWWQVRREDDAGVPAPA